MNDQDGHIIVSADYLKNGKERDLYLDIIQELVHVKQFFDGRELFDDALEYVDRPTEAYRNTVNEVRKRGMSDEEIYEYLRTEWMSVEELRRLATSVGVTISIENRDLDRCTQRQTRPLDFANVQIDDAYRELNA